MTLLDGCSRNGYHRIGKLLLPRERERVRAVVEHAADHSKAPVFHFDVQSFELPRDRLAVRTGGDHEGHRNYLPAMRAVYLHGRSRARHRLGQRTQREQK